MKAELDVQLESVIGLARPFFTTKSAGAEFEASLDDWIKSVANPRMRAVTYPLVHGTGTGALRNLSATIGIGFDVLKTGFLDYASAETVFLAKTMGETLGPAVAAVVQDSLAQGHTLSQVSARLRENFMFSRDRAKLVARTETTRAWNGSQRRSLEKYQADTGNKITKTWSAVLDDRVREEHEAMDGETVGIDEEFSNGLMEPSEPNCRCTLLYEQTEEPVEAPPEEPVDETPVEAPPAEPPPVDVDPEEITPEPPAPEPFPADDGFTLNASSAVFQEGVMADESLLRLAQGIEDARASSFDDGPEFAAEALFKDISKSMGRSKAPRLVMDSQDPLLTGANAARGFYQPGTDTIEMSKEASDAIRGFVSTSQPTLNESQFFKTAVHENLHAVSGVGRTGMFVQERHRWLEEGLVERRASRIVAEMVPYTADQITTSYVREVRTVRALEKRYGDAVVDKLFTSSRTRMDQLARLISDDVKAIDLTGVRESRQLDLRDALADWTERMTNTAGTARMMNEVQMIIDLLNTLDQISAAATPNTFNTLIESLRVK